MTEPTRRRGRKGERTRARILDSATELFSRSGFHAVSLRDIAAHAGLTHAGLLHHFPARRACSSRCSAAATRSTAS
ncbi:TetR/AcrR family transcriptional regulator [Nonomuraea sp. NPDC049684]|uniref:TetR/AcrR family transcriptional regulator n=1 Tax=Nonomuraea sp. NPDC049684 TaxID=3364356 RepID=UPI0037B1A94C